MAELPAPSRYILQKAWKLGQKMAYEKRSVLFEEKSGETDETLWESDDPFMKRTG